MAQVLIISSVVSGGLAVLSFGIVIAGLLRERHQRRMKSLRTA